MAENHPLITKSCIMLTIMTTFFVGAGCTVSRPDILELSWQINHRHDVVSDTKIEELSFWIHVEDQDGNDDIESVYLVHDSSELFWRLQADSWEQKIIGEELWIGHAGMRMYRESVFPRGSYRIIVVDRAGERAESSIYVSSDRVYPNDTEYPDARFEEGHIYITTPAKRISLWFYDGGSSVVKLYSTTSKIVPIAEVLSNQEQNLAVGVAIYAYDDSTGIGAISGIYEIE